MQPVVKDAHLASSSQQTGLDLTLFLEDVSDSSLKTDVSHPFAAATFPTLLLKASPDMQSQQHTARTSIKDSETKRPAPPLT